MGNTDSIPVISQVKSAVQAISGDEDGALQTQINFTKSCPVVSQITSAVQAVNGDTKAAEETQMYFLNNVSNYVDAIPVVGHVKGGIHYACGDSEGGDNAMRGATRTVFVTAGGIGGMVTGGPVGAVVGGIAGGVVGDSVITRIESGINGEYKPHGHFANIDAAIDGEMTAGEIYDAVAVVGFDAA